MNDAVRILQSVRRVEQCAEIYSKRLAHLYQVTTPQLVALLAIAENGSCTLKAIGQAIYLSASTVVGIVDRLEEKGLVQRARATQDRRQVYVSLTQKGQELLALSPSALPEGFSLALQMLSEQERETLVVTLERFATLLEAKVPSSDSIASSLPTAAELNTTR